MENVTAEYPGLSRVTIDGIRYAVLETQGTWIGESNVPTTDGKTFTTTGRKRIHTEDDDTNWDVVMSKLVDCGFYHTYLFIAKERPEDALRNEWL